MASNERELSSPQPGKSRLFNLCRGLRGTIDLGVGTNVKILASRAVEGVFSHHRASKIQLPGLTSSTSGYPVKQKSLK